MANKINLNNGGIYHFCYQHNPELFEDPQVLEEVVEKITTHLRGQSFVKEQRAEILVIGNDADNHIFVLNSPSDWALQKFEAENRATSWRHKRIGNQQIRRIIVRNMRMDGKESEILVADCEGAYSSRGYAYLVPHFLSCNTQELYAMLRELMDLRMFRISKSKLLTWLIHEYQKED